MVYTSNLALITFLWFGSLLFQCPSATATAGSKAAYEDTNNAYQPGQPLKTVLNTLDKVMGPVSPDGEDEPEVMHYLPVPSGVGEKVFETFLPTNGRWEIQFNPEGFKVIDLGK